MGHISSQAVFCQCPDFAQFHQRHTITSVYEGNKSRTANPPCNENRVFPVKKNYTGKTLDGIAVHTCHFFDSSFARKDNLKKHNESVHEINKPYKCDICDISFTQKCNLTSVHCKSKPFKCAICGTKFSLKFNMNAHIKLMHEGNRPFKCEMCFSGFSYEMKDDM